MKSSKSVFSKAWKIANRYFRNKKIDDVRFGIINDFLIVILTQESTKLQNCGYTSSFVYVVNLQTKTCKFITNNLTAYNRLL